MAAVYSLMSLRLRPHLIPACIKLLKDEWPHCKAELLPKIVKKEGTNVPCSYIMVQRPATEHEKDILVGHIRIVPVTNRQRAIHSESLCVNKADRGKGMGQKIMLSMEEFLFKMGYREVHAYISLGIKNYWLRRSWLVFNEPVHTIGANLLRTRTGTGSLFVNWPGNVPYPGWESEYEGGPIATEEDIKNPEFGCRIVKYLSGSTKFGPV